MRATRRPPTLPNLVADADLWRQIVRRGLLKVEHELHNPDPDSDLEALAREYDEHLELVAWADRRYYLLHDQMTEDQVPEELRLLPAA